jgi:hypothetical protein
MIDKQPFTIEILGLDHDHPVIVDRVIGGSVYLEEAKRIGQRLLAIADAETHPHGYRVLTRDCKLVYVGHIDDNGEQCSGSN